MNQILSSPSPPHQQNVIQKNTSESLVPWPGPPRRILPVDFVDMFLNVFNTQIMFILSG